MMINSAASVKNLIKDISPSRVASSARLAGTIGSEAQRGKNAAGLNNKFFALADDIFEQKIKNGEAPVLDGEEIVNCANKVIPGVAVKWEREARAGFDGGLRHVLDETGKKVVGFVLRTANKIEKGSNEDILRHEMRHLFDYVTQPKLLARTNTDSLTGRLKDYGSYADSLHFGFYRDNLYRPVKQKNGNKALVNLAKEIKEHFRNMQSPRDEKIEILQCWRSSLKTELNAYGDEANFVAPKNPDYLRENYGEFMFKEKITLVEKMLKDELTAARKLNAKKYGNK